MDYFFENLFNIFGGYLLAVNISSFWFLCILRNPHKAALFSNKITKFVAVGVVFAIFAGNHDLQGITSVYSLSCMFVFCAIQVIFSTKETRDKHSDFVNELMSTHPDEMDTVSVKYATWVYSNTPWDLTATEFLLPLLMTVMYSRYLA